MTPRSESTVSITEEVLEDKIRGGVMGHLIGALNGLPYEGAFIHQPAQIEHYVPSLPDGAWADDDNDIEWVYITAIDRLKKTYLSPKEITELWHKHINRQIWMSHMFVRQLMDIGLEPPLTGLAAFNPWAEFNVSGHFVCETFGLLAPAMPRTASRIGLHYTRVSIDGEPAQSTQLFNSMIATAFIEEDFEKVLAAGLAAVDPNSEIHRIVKDVTQIWRKHPNDWRLGRQQIKDRHQTRADGDARDWAGIELNTAAMIGAFLYGAGDFVETLRLSFNFGWDTDCNAATLGMIVGVMKGRNWMDLQKWTIKDTFRNHFRTEPKWEMLSGRPPRWSEELVRDEMPEVESITDYEAKVIAAAKRALLEHGSELVVRGGQRIYRIAAEAAANVEPLPRPLDRLEDLRRELVPQIEIWLGGSKQERARAAYVALCLLESERLERERPSEWRGAIEALEQYPQVLRQVHAAFRWPIRERIFSAICGNYATAA